MGWPSVRESFPASLTAVADGACRFCPFACIIENPDERLFTCQRDECGVVSCRGCQKVDHLPKTCAEVDQDKKIDGMHLVSPLPVPRRS